MIKGESSCLLKKHMAIKRTIITIIIVFILSYYSGYSETNMFLEGEIQSSPWFYEPNYKLNGISLSTVWMVGIQWDWFSVGLDLASDYVSLNGNNESQQLIGAWFDLSCNVVTICRLTSRLDLEAGIGFLWNQSSFDYNNSGWLGRSLFGIEVMVGSTFLLTRSLELEIINRLHLLLSQEAFMDNVMNTAGVRALINPGLPWLAVYAECDVLYWTYKSEVLPGGVKSWMFQGQIGVSFNIGKKQNGNVLIKKTMKEDILIKSQNETTDTLPDKNKTKIIEEDNEEKHDIDPSVAKLASAHPGDTLYFHNILFHNEELTDESKPVLNGIAEILIQNSALVISISGYSELIKDPLRELELCKIRANKVREYLIKQGVKETRIQLNPIGNIITDEKNYIMINVINR